MAGAQKDLTALGHGRTSRPLPISLPVFQRHAPGRWQETSWQKTKQEKRKRSPPMTSSVTNRAMRAHCTKCGDSERSVSMQICHCCAAAESQPMKRGLLFRAHKSRLPGPPANQESPVREEKAPPEPGIFHTLCDGPHASKSVPPPCSTL